MQKTPIEELQKRALKFLDQTKEFLISSPSIEIIWATDRNLAKQVRSVHGFLSQYRKLERDIPQYRELEKRHQELKDQLLLQASIYIPHLISTYNLTYHFQSILADKVSAQEVIQWGSVDYADRNGWIRSAYRNAFNQAIPDHPSMEYPNARSIHRHFVIHAGPTNSGKTYQAIERLKQVVSGLYLSPLRLLALEIYEKLNIDGVPCSLATGEEEVQVPFSNHLSCTVEKMSEFAQFDVVVIDECQMLQDDQRGHAWTRAILGAYAKEVHVCCAPFALPVIQKLIESCGDTFEVHQYNRAVPLEMQSKVFSFPKDIQPGDALIVFSRKEVLRVAEDLRKQGIASSVIYGSLPPEARRMQVELFASGKNKVVVSTDAIGMGINLPIKRIVFLQTDKFDGKRRRYLSIQEVKQIAGRAGRRGMYDVGLVAAIERVKEIQKQLTQEERPIEFLYLSPQEQVILNIPFGTLREKLLAWHEHPIQAQGFVKTNLEERLYLLDELEMMDAQLSEQEQFRAIGIPFPQNDQEVLKQWKSYVRQIESQHPELKKPHAPLLTHGEIPLHILEQYYRKIDLYYSMSRVFEKPFDTDWVAFERKRIVERIHLELSKDRKKKEKKLKCRKKIA